MTHEALNRFGDLEGVGLNIPTHLLDIGMRSKEDIAAGGPEEMYKMDCSLQDGTLDRCVLYVSYIDASTLSARLDYNIEHLNHRYINGGIGVTIG